MQLPKCVDDASDESNEHAGYAPSFAKAQTVHGGEALVSHARARKFVFQETPHAERGTRTAIMGDKDRTWEKEIGNIRGSQEKGHG